MSSTASELPAASASAPRQDLPKIRVFISSPGDVGEERRTAGRILDRFRDQYKAVCQIEGYFWEYERITAHFDFQEKIPGMEEFDVCMCILWSRMGSPPGKFRSDGSAYQSGTEYEIEQSIESFETNGRPELFVYRRNLPPVLDRGSDEERREAKNQYARLEQFFKDRFDGAGPEGRRATHSYTSLAEFEDRFSHHLHRIISDRLASERQTAVRWDRGSPFRGLNSFDLDHSSVFFGREADTERVVAKFCEQAAGQDRADDGACVLLLGASGSGKSSLAQAGVLPRIVAGGAGLQFGAFRYAIVRPGSGSSDPDPLGSLVEALQRADALPNIDTGFLARLRQEPGNAQQFVYEALQQYAPSPTDGFRVRPKLLLIVDQFEELFTRRETTDDQRRDFARALLSLKESGTTWILCTLRQDFYAEFCRVPELVELKGRSGQYDLSPPRAAEIEQIIRGPAQAAGLEYEKRSGDEDLYEIIRRKAISQPESLPLLEFCLSRLYDKMEERLAAGEGAKGVKLLSLDDYRHAGGIEGIVATQAEDAYQSVSEETRNSDALRRLLRMLVQVSADDGTVSRRAASRTDIEADSQTSELARAFVAARLLTAKDASFELTHEAVLRHWARSKEWLSLERPLLQARSRLQFVYFAPYKQALEEKRDVAKSLLPRGLPLEAAIGVWKAGLLEGSQFDEVRAYVVRSRRWHRTRSFRNLALVAMSVLVFVAIFLALFMTYRWATSIRLARVRLLQDAAVERHRAGDDGVGAVLLGLALEEAGRLDDDLERDLRMAVTMAEGRLLPLQSVWKAEGEVLRCCALSADGKTAALGTDGGRLYCIDLVQGEFVSSDGSAPFRQVAERDRIEAIAGHPARRAAFAVATATGRIHFVDLDAPPTVRVRELRYEGRPRCLTFTPDGGGLIVAGRPKQGAVEANGLVLFDVEAPGSAPRSFGVRHELYAVAVSGDGKWLIAGGAIAPNRITVWNLLAPPEARSWDFEVPSRVFTLAFRPGYPDQFVTGDVNGMVDYWSLSLQRQADSGVNAMGEPEVTFSGREINYGKQVRLTAFDDQGRFLLVGGESKTAQVWDVEQWRPVGQPFLHRDQVRSGTVSRASGRVVTADFSGDIRIWNLSPRVRGEAVYQHSAAVVTASFGEDGKEIVSGFPSGRIGGGPTRKGGGIVWDLETRRRVELPHGADVMAAHFRPGHPGEVVTCGVDGKVVLWKYQRPGSEQADGKIAVAQPQHVFDYGVLVYAASFSPSGDRLIFAGFGEGIHIYDYDGEKDQWTLHSVVKEDDVRTYIWGLRFDSQGQRFFSDAGPSVRAWRVSAGQVLTQDLKHPSLLSTELRKRNLVAGKPPPEAILSDLSPASNEALVRWTDGQVAVFDLDAVEPHPQLLGDHPHGDARGAADWSRDGRLIATGGVDGTAMVWTRRDGAWRPLELDGVQAVFRHPSPVVLLQLSPDGRWLATACEDGSLRLWSVGNGQWTGVSWYHSLPITRLQFSPDGRLILSASRDGTVKVVNLPTPSQGTTASVLNRLKADAGLEIRLAGEGTSATYSAPRAITASEFRRCRELENASPP